MKKIASRKVLIFPTRSAAAPTVSIHPDIWAETIRSSDARDLRLDKVSALRSAIAAGTYRIPTVCLAEKLIGHMRNNA